jgi:hypothetical protein
MVELFLKIFIDSCVLVPAPQDLTDSFNEIVAPPTK